MQVGIGEADPGRLQMLVRLSHCSVKCIVALTKLTNGLNNFMKDLRSQTANETVATEKGLDKGKGTELTVTEFVKNPEKGRGPDISQ
ncbi:hypothetical protein V6N11_053349 [Hibiscus sabdariffa]|uniref:Uncharacterized protein n=1 Tax=Hibiscus sabdariffa TaxID=183260 RepID=A0ABR2UDK0_9ROSI